MRLLLSAFAAAALTGSAFAGDSEATPPPPPPAGPPPADAPPFENAREANLKRLIAEHPELKGVDPDTPEGRARIQQVMQAKMAQNAPMIRERLARQQAAQHAELKKTLALKDEEFATIEPLLSKVESLKQQKGLADRSAGPGGPGFPGRRGGPGGPGGSGPDLKLILGDTPIDPAIQELQDGLKALKAAVEDAQANAAETTATAAIARVRKARAAFDTTLGKAEEALRAVLKPRQEAILVDRGILR